MMAYPIEFEPTASVPEIYEWLAARSADFADMHHGMATNPLHSCHAGRDQKANMARHAGLEEILRAREEGWAARARQAGR